MGKIATGGGEPRELIPARNYMGVICGVFEIGTQPGVEYGPNQQFIVMFELHTRRGPAADKQGNIFTISEYVNFLLGSRARPSNLLKLIEALEARTLSDDEIRAGYDVEKLLGESCQVQVIHKLNGKGEMKARIGGTMPLDPDDSPPTGELDPLYYEIGPDRAIPEWVPKFVQDSIRRSKEFGDEKPIGEPATVGAGVAGGSKDDEDIPF